MVMGFISSCYGVSVNCILYHLIRPPVLQITFRTAAVKSYTMAAVLLDAVRRSSHKHCMHVLVPQLTSVPRCCNLFSLLTHYVVSIYVVDYL